MFARLTGTIIDVIDPHVVIDVNGVGYLVSVSARTRARLTVGEAARLVIETVVREDAINLYGFIDVEEQGWFRLLTSVQGVGPRVGLAILSACPVADLGVALAVGDKAVLTRADGVGPKLATRIVTELKDKVPENLMLAGINRPRAAAGTADASSSRLASGGKATVGSSASVTSGSSPGLAADAVSALVNLGYGRTEAFSAVMRVTDPDHPQTVADMIKRALHHLTQGAVV
jgi:holliday junction DNA helicase RuvA